VDGDEYVARESCSETSMRKREVGKRKIKGKKMERF